MTATRDEDRRAVLEAAQTLTKPFDAFMIAKLCTLSVIDCAVALMKLAHEGTVQPLGESPEGEPFHVCERYVIAAAPVSSL